MAFHKDCIRTKAWFRMWFVLGMLGQLEMNKVGVVGGFQLEMNPHKDVQHDVDKDNVDKDNVDKDNVDKDPLHLLTPKTASQQLTPKTASHTRGHSRKPMPFPPDLVNIVSSIIETRKQYQEAYEEILGGMKAYEKIEMKMKLDSIDGFLDEVFDF